MQLSLSFIEEETNKLPRSSRLSNNIFSFFIWILVNTLLNLSLWNSRRLFLNWAREDSRRYAVTVAFFANYKKRRTDVTWNIAAYPSQDERVVWLITKTKKSGHLNLRVYRTSNARTHGSYISCFTTRKSTQCSWVVLEEKCLSPKI